MYAYNILWAFPLATINFFHPALLQQSAVSFPEKPRPIYGASATPPSSSPASPSASSPPLAAASRAPLWPSYKTSDRRRSLHQSDRLPLLHFRLQYHHRYPNLGTTYSNRVEHAFGQPSKVGAFGVFLLGDFYVLLFLSPVAACHLSSRGRSMFIARSRSDLRSVGVASIIRFVYGKPTHSNGPNLDECSTPVLGRLWNPTLAFSALASPPWPFPCTLTSSLSLPLSTA